MKFTKHTETTGVHRIYAMRFFNRSSLKTQRKIRQDNIHYDKVA